MYVKSGLDNPLNKRVATHFYLMNIIYLFMQFQTLYFLFSYLNRSLVIYILRNSEEKT